MSLEFFNRKHKMLNVDITHRCPLECLRCGRQTSFRNQGLAVPGHDLSLDDFEKITNHFPEVSFCGQYSDPIHHPQFLDILAICKKKNIQTEVHVASRTAAPRAAPRAMPRQESLPIYGLGFCFHFSDSQQKQN